MHLWNHLIDRKGCSILCLLSGTCALNIHEMIWVCGILHVPGNMRRCLLHPSFVFSVLFQEDPLSEIKLRAYFEEVREVEDTNPMTGRTELDKMVYPSPLYVFF